MASSAPLADVIEERFFWCPVCYEPFKDSKLLPCLHRYCRHCLDGIITADAKDSFNCPLCQQEHTKPEEGVDGFKSDFHINNVVEFLQLQTSFKEDDVKQCHGCKEVKKVIAYCFKCKNFLCQQCYDFHLNNDMVAEHRPHTLNLKDVDLKSITLEKLASLTEDPLCITHVKHLAQLCCETCGNLPICVACTYGDHQSHLIHDVKKLARAEREKLTTIMSELEKHHQKLYALPKKVENGRQKLRAVVAEKLEKAKNEYIRASEEVAKKVRENSISLEESTKEIKMRKEKECDQVKLECVREMEKVRQAYDRILSQKEAEYERETKEVEAKHGKIDDKLTSKSGKMKDEYRNFKEKVEANNVVNTQEFQEIADHSEHTITRYENFTATSSTVLASKDEWTDARCLPDINAASEPLIRDVKKEFENLESLSDINVSDLSLKHIGEVSITEEESVVNIKDINNWSIYGITCSHEGHIVITGSVRDGKHSHITVINREGVTVRRELPQKVAGSEHNPVRFCASLSQSLIVTACQSNQVGIYDAKKGKYVKKNLKELNINWPGHVTCVTTDTMNNIYLGGRERDVLIFDIELKYQRTLRLPPVIGCPRDMTVHEGHLLVCDFSGHVAYAVTMEGQEAKLVYQFAKPDLDGANWYPLSVCTDSSQYIYMLWESVSGCVLTQYSQNGGHLLTTKKVANNAWQLTSLVTGNGEKLLIVTQSKQTLHTYGLNK